MTLLGRRHAGPSANRAPSCSSSVRVHQNACEVVYDPTFVDRLRIDGYGRRRTYDVDVDRRFIKQLHRSITEAGRGGAEAPDRC